MIKIDGKMGLGFIFFGLTLASATVSSGDDRIGVKIEQKFIRGMANTFTGWVEMPKQIYLRTAQGPPALGVIEGIFEGLGMTFARTSAGLYEIATFPVPLPLYYRPLFEPEYVWQAEGTNEGASLFSLKPHSSTSSDDGQVDKDYLTLPVPHQVE